jgi:hypothetical protein
MNCIIEDYSEKAIAVFGDTKPISERLGAIQGSKFNPCLRGVGENKRPGWIFPKTRRSEVESLLQSIQQEVKTGDFKPSQSDLSNKPKTTKTNDLRVVASASSSVDSSVLSRIEILEAKVETLTKALSALKTNTPPSDVSAKPKASKTWADEEDEDEEEVKPRGLLRSARK